MPKGKISVVIPAYNESGRIRESLGKIIKFFKRHKLKNEIIVVDDGSKDDTIKVARAAMKDAKNSVLLENKKNMGKGCSVKRGMLKAKGDLLLFSDADLSTPIDELRKLIVYAGKYDVIIASRALPGSNIVVRQPKARELLGKIFNLLVRIFLVRGVRDTQCGFKLFTKKAAGIIFKRQTVDGFAFDVELLYIAKKHGLKIKEVPVSWFNSKNTKLKVGIDSIRMFGGLLRIPVNNTKGKYD